MVEKDAAVDSGSREKRAASGGRAGRCPGIQPGDLGLGMLWAWIYCTWFTSAVFPDAGPDARAVSNDVTWLVSLATCATLLLVLARALRERREPRPAPVLGAAFAVFAGTLALGLDARLADPRASDALAVAGTAVAAAATGLGSAVMWAAWGKRCEGSGRARLVAPVSAIVVVAALAICALLPDPVSFVACLALPVVSAGLHLASVGDAASVRSAASGNRAVGNDGAASEKTPAPSSQVLDRAKARGVLRVLCAATAASCAVGTFAQATALDVPAPGLLLAGALLGALIVVAATLPALLSRRLADFVRPARMLLLAEAAGLALLVAAHIAGARALAGTGYVLVCAASVCFDFLLFAYLVGLIDRGLFGCAEAFCLSEGSVQVGWLVGNAAGIVVARFLAGTLQAVAGAATVYDPATSVQGAAVQAGLAGGQILPLVYLALVCALFLLLTIIVDQQGSAERIAAARPEVDAACVVAAHYGLTPRETEILSLLAQGRSIPYVSDAIFLARSTVETHAKHIYAKLGVHTRQELLDLVDQYR